MSKVNLPPIPGGYLSLGAMNSRFAAIEAAFENTLSRDGSLPNSMEADLDLNGNLLLNIAFDPTNPDSVIPLGAADDRYVNRTGDSMLGGLAMGGNAITVRTPVGATEPAQKQQLDAETASRVSADNVLQSNIDAEQSARVAADAAIINSFQSADSAIHSRIDGVEGAYQAADANLQDQISGGSPLEASAFSPISWHEQVVSNSVTIPENKNAWSFGPVMSIAAGQSVTVGAGSYWTIANGELVQ